MIDHRLYRNAINHIIEFIRKLPTIFMKIALIFDPEIEQRFIWMIRLKWEIFVCGKKKLIHIDSVDMVAVKVKRFIASITFSDTWPIQCSMNSAKTESHDSDTA